SPELSASALAELEHIARTKLRVFGFEASGNDNLDYHILSSWTLGDALKAAYLAGMVDHHRTT
uniref:DUF6900 domain-containing protein n=1 Tax=Zoogloea sp. TaxID=49181 RepID=UPI0035B083EF